MWLVRKIFFPNKSFWYEILCVDTTLSWNIVYSRHVLNCVLCEVLCYFCYSEKRNGIFYGTLVRVFILKLILNKIIFVAFDDRIRKIMLRVACIMWSKWTIIILHFTLVFRFYSEIYVKTFKRHNTYEWRQSNNISDIIRPDAQGMITHSMRREWLLHSNSEAFVLFF